MKQQIKNLMPYVWPRLRQTWHLLRRLNPFISERYMYLFRGRYFDFKTRKIIEIKPNLVIIGAEKSGTTSLHHYLDQHPDIFMAKPNKEPQYMLPFSMAKEYFWRSKIIVRNKHDILKNHMASGYRGEKYFGESTTSYTRGKNAEKRHLAKELRTLNPKLIYIVRHPMERMQSNHLHKRRGSGIATTFDEELNIKKSYLLNSLYGYQLAQYLQEFDLADIYFVYFENFIKDPVKELSKMSEFLGLDSSFEFKADKVHNKATNKGEKVDNHKMSSETYDRITSKLVKDLKLLEKSTNTKAPWKFNKNDWT